MVQNKSFYFFYLSTRLYMHIEYTNYDHERFSFMTSKEKPFKRR